MPATKSFRSGTCARTLLPSFRRVAVMQPTGRDGRVDARLGRRVPELPHGQLRATALERAFSSVVAAPLRVRGDRIGVIGTISRDPVEYHASDLRLLDDLGRQVGVAAHAALLTEDLRASRERRRFHEKAALAPESATAR